MTLETVLFPSPSLVLSVLKASIYALLSHLIWGGGVAELALYWAIGSLGFGLGQALSRLLPFEALTIGDVHLLEGTLGCWFLLFIVKRLKA